MHTFNFSLSCPGFSALLAPSPRHLSSRVLLALAFIVLASPGEVFAYGWRECLGERIKWRSNYQVMRASPVSFPPGSVWYNSLQRGINGFNLNPSNFRLGLTTDSGGVATGNDINEVWLSRSQSLLEGAPAVAITWRTCYWFFGNHVYLTEGDVVFDTDWRWTPYNNKNVLIGYGGRYRLMDGTAAHEFGHVLGLLHENRRYNVMGADYQHLHVNGNIANTYAGVDAGNGAEYLYGTRSETWEDLGVVHWKYDRPSGEYSRHRKTELYSSTGGLLPRVDVEGETGYRVAPGEEIRAEFTYENNGKSQLSANVGFYISSNDIISTADRRIGGGRFTFPHYTLDTATHVLTIPNDLVADENYWLGVIVDEDNAISETVEWNNATYIPLEIFETEPRDDHGNDRDTATVVAVQSSTSGNLETGGDVDMFRFVLSETSSLEIRTEGSTDTFGTLYRESTEIDSDDDGGTNTNFLISVPAATAGTYYVEVRGFFSGTTGAYTLEIEAEDVNVHELPFMPGAPRFADGTLDRSRSHQSGILRVSNLSGMAGEVLLEGFDESGVCLVLRWSPLSWSLRNRWISPCSTWSPVPESAGSRLVLATGWATGGCAWCRRSTWT